MGKKLLKQESKLREPIVVISGDKVEVTFTINIEGFKPGFQYFRIEGFDLRIHGKSVKT